MAYKCGICGTEYETVRERMNCEMICSKKIEEDARKIAEAKKKAEKDARQLEIDKAIEYVDELIGEFIKDYGSYQYKGKEFNDCFKKLWTPFFWF